MSAYLIIVKYGFSSRRSCCTVSNGKGIVCSCYADKGNSSRFSNGITSRVFCSKSNCYHSSVRSVAKVGRFYSVVIIGYVYHITTTIGSCSRTQPSIDASSILTAYYERCRRCKLYCLRVYNYCYCMSSLAAVIAFYLKGIGYCKGTIKLCPIIQECRRSYIGS